MNFNLHKFPFQLHKFENLYMHSIAVKRYMERRAYPNKFQSNERSEDEKKTER